RVSFGAQMTAHPASSCVSATCLILVLASCSTPPASPGISISTDFEGGCLANVEKMSEARFRCAIPGQADHEGRNRQASWYYFRVDGAKGREVTVVLTDLKGEYNYQPAPACVREDTPPVASGDGKTWRHLDRIRVENNEATIRFIPDSDTFWVAHLEPYPASRLDRFLDEIRGGPGLTIGEIGKSVEGRSLPVLTISESLRRDPIRPPVVWLMCRQHAWETGTSFAAEGAIRFLLSDAGESLRRKAVFKILPMMDPDGCAHGGVRFNRNGYDVNRNWDTADPDRAESRRLMPEICAAKAAIRQDPGCLLTLHNQEAGEWLSGSQKHPEIADRFFVALRDRSTFDPSEKGPRPPTETLAPGRYSVYEYFDRQQGMPAFLLEQGITRGKKLARLPTSQDRREFGRQLIQVWADIALGKGP
ncbi:MAG TPA: M14-type cytosolic carboxypeptidase, partial [Planctomycetota bacterium]|nr:M14-type cytosolic carboxypeptidase [Planctomycetota bacterium]